PGAGAAAGRLGRQQRPPQAGLRPVLHRAAEPLAGPAPGGVHLLLRAGRPVRAAGPLVPHPEGRAGGAGDARPHARAGRPPPPPPPPAPRRWPPPHSPPPPRGGGGEKTKPPPPRGPRLSHTRHDPAARLPAPHALEFARPGFPRRAEDAPAPFVSVIVPVRN